MAVNAAATVSTANGIAKRVHGKVVDLEPKKALKFVRDVDFDGSSMLGSEYVEQVWLTGEHGFTYAGSSGAKVTLNSSEVAESQLASLTPSALHFRSEVVIELLSRASQAGEKAFEGYMAALMRNAKRAFDKRIEFTTGYGGQSIGTLTSATDAGTTSVFTITLKTYMPGPWIGSRNCAIDAYNGATKLNTNADLNVTKHDPSTRQVTVTGNATDIDTIMAVGTNGSGVELYFKGQYGNEGTGIRGIANLSSGTYLGISADNYKDVWNATQVTTWDADTDDFTWDTLQEGIEEAVGRGCEGDLCVMVPNPVWTTLNSSLDALRVLDSSFQVNKAEMGRGIDSIAYHSLNGKCLIKPSNFVKYGDVIAYPDPGEDEEKVRRIGSTNTTFNVPGRGTEMFKIKEDTNTVEYRAFSDQSPWSCHPRDFILFSG
jgi:hypothetical protein